VEEDLGDGDPLLAVGPERLKDRRNGVIEVEKALGCEFEHGETHRRFDCRVRVEPFILTRLSVRLGVYHLTFETDCELKAWQATLIDFATRAFEQVVKARRNDPSREAHSPETVAVLDERPRFPTTGTSAFIDRCRTTPFQTPTPYAR